MLRDVHAIRGYGLEMGHKNFNINIILILKFSNFVYINQILSMKDKYSAIFICIIRLYTTLLVF